MIRLLALIAAAVCFFFAAIGDTLHAGERSVSLVYLGFMFWTVAWMALDSYRHRS